jgi:hypothetical protein
VVTYITALRERPIIAADRVDSECPETPARNRLKPIGASVRSAAQDCSNGGRRESGGLRAAIHRFEEPWPGAEIWAPRTGPGL